MEIFLHYIEFSKQASMLLHWSLDHWVYLRVYDDNNLFFLISFLKIQLIYSVITSRHLNFAIRIKRFTLTLNCLVCNLKMYSLMFGWNQQLVHVHFYMKRENSNLKFSSFFNCIIVWFFKIPDKILIGKWILNFEIQLTRHDLVLAVFI